jgi:hypothetical protein
MWNKNFPWRKLQHFFSWSCIYIYNNSQPNYSLEYCTALEAPKDISQQKSTTDERYSVAIISYLLIKGSL